MDERESYDIGATIYWRGDEVTIISAPYSQYGGSWQDARKSDGTIISVATPGHVRRGIAMRRKEYEDLQTGFRRLHARTSK